MPLKELLIELRKAYVHASLNCGDEMLPPASESAITDIGIQLGLPIPDELRELLLIHGGQEYILPGITGLFGSHRLHTPKEIVANYQIYTEHCVWDPLPEFPPRAGDWGYWNPALIPFASWDANDLCIHAKNGDVWEFCPNIGLTGHRPSIASIVQELIFNVRGGEREFSGFPDRKDM